LSLFSLFVVPTLVLARVRFSWFRTPCCLFSFVILPLCLSILLSSTYFCLKDLFRIFLCLLLSAFFFFFFPVFSPFFALLASQPNPRNSRRPRSVPYIPFPLLLLEHCSQSKFLLHLRLPVDLTMEVVSDFIDRFYCVSVPLIPCRSIFPSVLFHWGITTFFLLPGSALTPSVPLLLGFGEREVHHWLCSFFRCRYLPLPL